MGLTLDSVRPLTGKYAKQVVMLSVMQTDEINVSSDDNTMSLSDRQFCHRLLKSPFRQRRLRTSATHLEHNPFFFQAPQPGSDTYSEPCHTPSQDSLGQTNNSSSHLHTRMDRMAKAAWTAGFSMVAMQVTRLMGTSVATD